ncbi:General transcription factor II-I repeat domain-containing protein 2A [Thelohanellus kitauei]|uniref:General transcription factor II-I repeat domain-containing protein 2A n=1 Tax=Thelohanellus kitauei TaxID=669202 RepID=A0A0C2N587_THEKT|nr:General transcription factor II-I repeat domain-containing protein 2A [Thelohanellus kitauei]
MTSLHCRTCGEDTFRGVNSVLSNLKIEWSKLSTITENRDHSMVRRKSGFIVHLLSYLQGLGISTQDICVYHFMIHQESIWARALKFDHFKTFVFKKVNFMRSRGLSHSSNHFLKIMKQNIAIFRFIWISGDSVVDCC